MARERAHGLQLPLKRRARTGLLKHWLEHYNQGDSTQRSATDRRSAAFTTSVGTT